MSKDDFDMALSSAAQRSKFTSECTTAKICKSCVKGKGGKGGICTSCVEGSFQDQEGQTSCGGCTAGKYQDDKGSEACKVCPVGRYLGVTGGKKPSRK